jgi:uncharacterized membrane protein
MDETPPIGAMEPAQNERTMAALAHMLQPVAGWIAPLAILLLKRESRFVSFHALQALLLQIVCIIAMCFFVVMWFGTFFLALVHHGGGGNATPAPAVFILFPLIWLGFMGFWVVMLVIAVVYGIKAGRGEWAEYPLLGSLSRKLLKIGPGGAIIS